ncbi:MAG TPA: hypothetical protein VFL91_09775 [Thermomicrobiales bacterium]|nr:hypothetical protein [Thermomicrobiales bacterium]
MRPPLRVGIVLDSPAQPRWIHHLLRELRDSAIAEIVLVVHDETAAPRRGRPGAPLGYRLYAALDARVFRVFRRQADALGVAPLAGLLADCPSIGLGGPGPSPATLAAIRAHDLDVILDLGTRLPAATLARAARHGVWSWHHGHDPATRGGPAGAWEVLEGRPVTGSLLTATTGDGAASRVIARSFAPTDPRSVARGLNHLCWKTAAAILCRLRDLHERGPAALATVSPPPDVPPTAPRHCRPPTNREMAALGARLLGRFAAEKARGIGHTERWALAYALPVTEGSGSSLGTQRFTYLVPPRDRFWADPFPIRHGDGYVLFFEEYLYATGRAHIAAMPVDRHGACGAPTTVLARDYHLSYPFVFAWDGDYYMLPETRGNRTVELYRATRFPGAWELDRVLLDGINAVDATIARIAGRWWLFVNVAGEGAATTDEVHLYRAEHPFGPWRPHPRNPIKADVRSARPAGRIICRDGRYYRPSQDCSGRYGRAIVLNEIVRIDHDDYVEREVGRIEPEPSAGLLGTHTVNRCDDLVCLDGVLRWRTFPRRWAATPAAGLVGAAPAGTAAPRGRAGLPLAFRASGLAAEVLLAPAPLTSAPGPANRPERAATAAAVR